MRSLCFAVLLAPLLGCSENVNVGVNCITTADPAVECTATQTEGKSEVEACWGFELTCANGAKVTAPRSCVKVKDGGSEKVTIPGDKLTGVDKCGGDKPPTGRLVDTTLNGKPTDK